MFQWCHVQLVCALGLLAATAADTNAAMEFCCLRTATIAFKKVHAVVISQIESGSQGIAYVHGPKTLQLAKDEAPHGKSSTPIQRTGLCTRMFRLLRSRLWDQGLTTGMVVSNDMKMQF